MARHKNPFLSASDHATDRIDIIDENEISFPACPSSCRCECPPIVYQDASAKIPLKVNSISNRVGNHTLESNELQWVYQIVFSQNYSHLDVITMWKIIVIQLV